MFRIYRCHGAKGKQSCRCDLVKNLLVSEYGKCSSPGLMLFRSRVDFNIETPYVPAFSVCTTLRGQQLKGLCELHHLRDLNWKK